MAGLSPLIECPPEQGDDHAMFPVKHSELIANSLPGDTLELCFGPEFGIGVRTLVGAAEGDLLDRFDGRIEPHVSQHSLQVAPGAHIVDTRFIGYLSHGCEPNCALDMPARSLVALRDIAAGELLRIDYSATEDTLFADFACACGAETCRDWITGRLGARAS